MLVPFGAALTHKRSSEHGEVGPVNRREFMSTTSKGTDERRYFAVFVTRGTIATVEVTAVAFASVSVNRNNGMEWNHTSR
jgi:hypothetical protein